MSGAIGASRLTASGAVKARAGLLWGATLKGGSAQATVTIYDHPSAASGDVLAELTVGATATATFTPAASVSAGRGIYADLSGTGASAVVYFA